MLENRDYMREEPAYGGGYRFHWSASIVLMIALVVAFALQCVNDVHGSPLLEGWLALTPLALLSGYVWQFLTFQFLHVDLMHLIGNLLGLWFLGRPVENILGKKKFLFAYFGAGVMGGLLQCILMVVFPRHFVPFVFGASAGVMGIFAIFAWLQRESTILWSFFIPIRADVLLWITAGVSLFFTVIPSQKGGNYAHAAHLGGILAGLAWVKLGWHHDYVTLPWEGLFSRWRRWKPLQSRQRKRELVRAAKVGAVSWKRPSASEVAELPSDEFISKEVDPILDKISAHGIHSLTERERKILDAARKKMAKP